MYLEDGDGDTRAARRSAGPASRTVVTIACAVVVLGVVPTFEGIAWLMTALGLR